jgi:hypothetical protein
MLLMKEIVKKIIVGTLVCVGLFSSHNKTFAAAEGYSFPCMSQESGRLTPPVCSDTVADFRPEEEEAEKPPTNTWENTNFFCDEVQEDKLELLACGQTYLQDQFQRKSQKEAQEEMHAIDAFWKPVDDVMALAHHRLLVGSTSPRPMSISPHSLPASPLASPHLQVLQEQAAGQDLDGQATYAVSRDGYWYSSKAWEEAKQYFIYYPNVAPARGALKYACAAALGIKLEDNSEQQELSRGLKNLQDNKLLWEEFKDSVSKTKQGIKRYKR